MPEPVVNFDLAVLQASQQTPVLVDFWAPWCGPCKMLKPQLERLAQEAGGSWQLVKINTDEQQDLAQQHGVRGIPDVRLYHRGAEIGRFSGYLPEPELRKWLSEHLPSPRRDALAQAHALLAAGQTHEAAALLAPLHAATPDDAELTATLARALVFAEPARAVELVKALPQNPDGQDAARIVTTLAGALAILQDEDRLPPSALRARYLLSLRHLQSGDFRSAAEGLVDLLLEQPDYDDGRARAACLALFQYLGLRHAVTEEFHRRYSMAVNC